jgi:predicted ATPase
MIDRVYIDNYKSFVNFECRLGPIQLILGENGTGKTTFLDVLESLREFITVAKTSEEAFPASTLTAWDLRSAQTFELNLAGNGGQYFYRLVIDHDRKTSRNRIESEELQFDRGAIYRFDGRDAHLFRTISRSDRFSRLIGPDRPYPRFPNEMTIKS